MRIGSLFSGAGGLDMAVEAVFGGTTVWHCENDPAASKVLAHRWPRIPNHHDITTVDWDTVQPVDILCGGWPCQPFSQAGKRLGAQDERALWPHVAGAIRMVRPRWVVLENVSAVLTTGEFQRVADDLAALRYEFGWVCVRASDVGAPHRRERVFILAADTDQGQRRWRTNEHEQPTGCAARNGHIADSSGDGRHQRWPQPARLIGGSDAAVSSAGPVDLLPTPSGSPALLPTPNAADGERGQDFARANRDGSGGDDLVTLAVKADRDHQWGKYAPAIRRWELTLNGAPAPAPTEPNRNGNPRLNPAFSEWMMGWPQGWVTQVPGISRNDQLKIIGNGVCPQQAVAAINYLLSTAPLPMMPPDGPQNLLPTPQRRDGDAGPASAVGGIRPSGQPRQKDLNTIVVRELS